MTASPRRSSVNGSTLVELMIALAMLAVVLVPLGATAHALLARSGRIDWTAASTERSIEAWTWGARPGRVAWTVGPRLDIRVLGPGTSDAESVGVWVGGRLWAEFSLDGPDVQVGDPGAWLPLAGAEVIVRARREGGPWGAPWRGIVPAGVPDAPPASPLSVVPAGAVMHLAEAGAASAKIQVGPSVATAGCPATPTSVPVLTGGIVDVTMNGCVQSWRIAEGETRDLYY